MLTTEAKKSFNMEVVMDFNYDHLRPMDGVCTAASSIAGRLIRLWTAHLKGFNGLKEMFRLEIANHFGYIVQLNDKYWIAEMLAKGLKINSLKEYLRRPDKDKIVRIVRHSLFDTEKIRMEANDFLVQKAHDLVAYDWKGSPGAFVGLCGNGPEQWYCSEMGEEIINRFGGTWDTWQLKRSGKSKRIAPVEIYAGNCAVEVQGWLKQ